MNDQKQRSERIILLTLATFLPTVVLIPIGGYALWRDGYILHWALGSLSFSGIIFALQSWLLAAASAPTAPTPPLPDPARSENPASPDAKALAAVSAFAETVDIEAVTTPDGALALAEKTLATVAAQFHPGRPDAVWQFTVPQALAITEQVSRRLQDDVVSRIPFGDRLTLAMVFNLYRFRSVFSAAERLYDVWRLIRLVNPATAVTNEAREKLSKAALGWGRDQFMRKLTRAYVVEVGRAGIDLYRGRLSSAPTPHPDGK